MEEGIRKILKLDDAIDIKSLIDSSLTYEENLENIKDQLGFKVRFDIDKYNEQLAEYRKQFQSDIWGWVDKVSAVGIIGGQQSGKTAIAFTLLEQSNKPVYVLRHPKPYIIRALGYNIIYDLADIEKLQDCVIFVDDIQLVLPTYDKRANDHLMRLLSKSAQRGITIIFTTNDTRFVTRGLESYINVWITKDIEAELVKQGSLVKKIIRRYTGSDISGFRLQPNEYLFYARNYPELEGMRTFEPPIYFNDEFSKSYRTATNSPKTPILEKIKEVLR